MKKNKFVFLILHYLTFDETVKCVDSIKKMCENQNYEILIVDNASTNKTGKKLEEKYKNDNVVTVLLSNENLGFANGNNLGFKYAKENMNPDFIVMLNNDTYLLDKCFCELVLEEYELSNFDVLGPRILMTNNRVCDFYDKKLSTKEIKRKINLLNVEKIFNYLFLHKVFVYFRFFVEIIKKIFMSKKIYKVDTSIRKENVVLQGCFLIFSKNYINKFDGIDDRTFLYNEEQLLYIRLEKNKMKSVYNPFIIIYHNENSSTNAAIKFSRKRNKFVIENELKSSKILLDELMGDEKYDKKNK